MFDGWYVRFTANSKMCKLDGVSENHRAGARLPAIGKTPIYA